ncbi:hypothetical protein PtrSN002B_008876 [Pyrenophora tritici-repentis]|uniref:Uncharacterized protein n=2 Tax=Pyrenophora tritici-repentis TaxID=45151 RepID=A0A2W1DDY6_9PLEO|nr:uncharacterized protein PTRG_07464 [Pyrenophora tritici-repentis Pt-1C-BFP]KAF7444877.1 hypothetical protein A1F99_114300 [Pyrenophora tritici-repentis]EDU50383.1 conserved hypothetical protein [Pyrenophora tritici-repentis Pt-1C-BFP]KAF7564454.1 hypothetical protein PtrM4_038880 [Pyrenophora tritici-repentis]KAG9379118.1 hypothetical protein A1F94_010887 [Pyrenophora tritici-repentis]KAI0577435.1 hypothetical protein Alg215_06905 [Pyrenophora tritici-repentis]
MSDIASDEDVARYAGHDGHSRSGSPELCGTQTANIDKQSEGPVSTSSSISAERDNYTTVSKLENKPDMSQTTNGATAVRSNPVEEQKGFEREGVTLSLKSLSTKAQHLCRVADDILGCMKKVEEAMLQFKQYIQAEKDGNKPLYKWSKFEGYRVISRSINDLDEAAAKLEPADLPRPQVKIYLSRATQISLAVSQIAVFAMGVMSEKSANCIDEIEESSLSAECKGTAHSFVTTELKKLLKHCARATERVYAALDLLRQSLTIDESYQNPDMPLIKELIAEREARLHASRTSWLWNAAGIVLGAATSAAIGLTAARLYGAGGFDLESMIPSSSVHGQVMNLVHRAQAVTNLTGEIYKIKLEDLGQRYNDLVEVSESYGLRIDNLVEALGVPNEQGTYFLSAPSDSTPKTDCQVPEDIRAYMKKISADANRQLERLRSEMELMRKNVHRMDIRLTKRLDKVDRYGL